MLRGLLALWLSMLFLWVVSEDGGGGAAEDDFLIDDPEPAPKEPEAPKDPAPAKEVEEKPPMKAELNEDDKKELDELKAFKDSVAVEKAITDAVDVIKGDYPDFDIEKVSAILKEMHEKDPKKAEQYNTPAGWEALHLKHFAAREEDGTFDPGRNNADEPYEFEKTRKEALGGNKKSMKKLFENAK